jgi:hypothetical protein
MATVRLRLRECREDGLPDVCMQCGDPARHFKDRQFSWYPKWILALLPLGLLPCAIVVSIMTWRRMVTVPLCEAHRNHWLKRQLIGVGALFGTIALIIVLFVGASELDPKMDTLGPVASILALVLLIAMIVVLAVAAAGTIQPTEITERTITLKNVGQTFVDALEDFREEEEERRFNLDRNVQDRWRDRSRDRDRDDRDYRDDRRDDRDERRPAREDERDRYRDRYRDRSDRDREDWRQDDRDRDEPPQRPRDRYRDDD